MWSIIKEYRHYLVTLVLALIPLITLNTGGKSPAALHWFDRAALFLSEPAQASIRWSIDGAWGLLENYLFVLEAKEVAEDTAVENRKLLNELASFREMEKENERLRRVVDFKAAVEGKRVVARVVAQDVSTEFRMLRLDKGSTSGIEAGMSVVALEGVVGRVLRVGPDYSDVLTLLDSSSAVDAIVQRSRVRGIIEGKGERYFTMKYLRRTDDVQEGDVIISSGIGGIFPKGLLLGKVEAVRKKNHGISQDVEVTPMVEFAKLEEVVVVDPPRIPEPRLEPEKPKVVVKAPAKAAEQKEP